MFKSYRRADNESSADKFGGEIRLNTEFISRRFIPVSSVNTTYPADFVTSYIVKMGNVGFFGEFKNFKMATISCYMSLFFWCTGVALATRDSPRVLYCMEGEFEKIITNFE